MKELMAEAIRFTMAMEQESCARYRKAAAVVADPAGKRFFEKLARDRSRRIDMLSWEVPDGGTFPCRAHAAVAAEAPAPEPSGAFLDQLRAALLDKRFSIGIYAALCKGFREPALCRFFARLLDAARREFREIKAEYLRIGVAFSPRLPGRPPVMEHLRGSLHHLAPNRHSQLFFSMQDCGRQPRLG